MYYSLKIPFGKNPLHLAAERGCNDNLGVLIEKEKDNQKEKETDKDRYGIKH